MGEAAADKAERQQSDHGVGAAAAGVNCEYDPRRCCG